MLVTRLARDLDAISCEENGLLMWLQSDGFKSKNTEKCDKLGAKRGSSCREPLARLVSDGGRRMEGAKRRRRAAYTLYCRLKQHFHAICLFCFCGSKSQWLRAQTTMGRSGIILAWILRAPMAHRKNLRAPFLKNVRHVIIGHKLLKLLWKTRLFWIFGATSFNIKLSKTSFSPKGEKNLPDHLH